MKTGECKTIYKNERDLWLALECGISRHQCGQRGHKNFQRWVYSSDESTLSVPPRETINEPHESAVGTSNVKAQLGKLDFCVRTDMDFGFTDVLIKFACPPPTLGLWLFLWVVVLEGTPNTQHDLRLL